MYLLVSLVQPLPDIVEACQGCSTFREELAWVSSNPRQACWYGRYSRQVTVDEVDD